MKIINLAMFLIIFLIFVSLIEAAIAAFGFTRDMTVHAISGFGALIFVVTSRQEINDIIKKMEST